MRYCLIGLVAATLLTAKEEKMRIIRFGKDDVGKLPAGWKNAKTNAGEGSDWRVTTDATAPSKSGLVISQTAKGPRPLFNLCVAPDTRYKDVEISVAFKALKGEIDQGGGVFWRYQDANNYYTARFNPLEGNYRVYKVIDGKRVQLETKEDLKGKAGEWHTLKVRHAGDKIECWYDGKKELEAKDSAIAKAGAIGLWTKADAVTSFDDLRATKLD
jgi:hypothetical protein